MVLAVFFGVVRAGNVCGVEGSYVSVGSVGGSGVFGGSFVVIIVKRVVSLFKGSVLEFTLPLCLLDRAGSSSLFKVIITYSFVPVVVLKPVNNVFTSEIGGGGVVIVLSSSATTLVFVFALLLKGLGVV